MKKCDDNIKSKVWFVVKVLLWYFFYQIACTCGFNLLDWAMSAITGVRGYFSATFMLSGSLFLSALLMVWHLLVFGYVKISFRILRGLSPSVLIKTVALIFGSMYLFNVMMEWVSLPDLMEDTFFDMSGEPLGVISMALLAPLVEELMFRGAIQGYLMRCCSPRTGVIASAVIFGVIHMNPQQVVYATLLGLVLGWIYYRTRSLLPVIVGHVLNNSVAVVTMKVWGAEDMEALTADSTLVMIPFLLVIAVVLLKLAISINRELPPVPSPWRAIGE